MTEKELREIRRRFRPEKSNIPKIVGCFVGENKQIISHISQPIGLTDTVVTDKLLSALKKAVSGSLGVNLTEIEYSTKQVSDSAEHKLLMKLRNSKLEDKDALCAFYSRVIESLELETGYAILLANDIYDVPSFSKSGDKDDTSFETHSYIVCAICPLKSLPEAIRFSETDSLFHLLNSSLVLSPAELGFTFPAFDDRRSNIYGALFYVKNLAASYPEFKKNILDSEPHMPPLTQKAAFGDILSESLGEECTLSVVRSVQTQVKEMLDTAKETKSEEPVILTKETVKLMLENCGIAEERLEGLSQGFDESFGKNAALTPKCVVKTDKFKMEMPEVKIDISEDYKDIVSTQTIGEDKYLLIKVTGPVTVNGINIKIEE